MRFDLKYLLLVSCALSAGTARAETEVTVALPFALSDGTSGDKPKIQRLGDGTLVATYGDSPAGAGEVYDVKADEERAARDVFVKTCKPGPTKSCNLKSHWSAAVNVSGSALEESSGVFDWRGVHGTPAPYPGDIDKVNIKTSGPMTVLTWVSKSCPGGEQRAIRYLERDDRVIPFSCAWVSWSTTKGATWSTPIQLSSGRRDAIQDASSGNIGTDATNLATYNKGQIVISWQEDPQGLQLGEADGPGDGASGANVNGGTDVWYARATVDLSVANTPADDFVIAASTRLTDNWEGLYGISGSVNYVYDDADANAPEDDLEKGRAGASRPNIGMVGSTTIIAYEETKGSIGLDEGKFIRYHAFPFASPPATAAGKSGCIISDPTKNARRVRFLTQSGTDAGPGGIQLAIFWKEGSYDKGGPSDIMVRRGMGGLQPANMTPAVDPGCATSDYSVAIALASARGDNISSDTPNATRSNLGDDTERTYTENALAHRGVLRGDDLWIGFSYTRDLVAMWAQLDNYNFWIRKLNRYRGWSDPQNVTNITDTRINVREPRLVGTPKSNQATCPTGDPADPTTTDVTSCQNAEVILLAWGTQTNVSPYDPDGGQDLGEFVTVSMDSASTFPTPVPLSTVQGVFWGDEESAYESQLNLRPDGTRFYGVWNQKNLISGATVAEYTSGDVVHVPPPADMRTDVAPGCTDDGEPTLVVSWANTGGVTLTDVAVTVTIPKVGDGSGTQADASFVRLEDLPNGATVDYQAASLWSPTPPTDLSTVTAVRVTEPAPLPVLEPTQTFRVVLSLPPGTPDGALIIGSATIEAGELAPVAATNVAPIEANQCPGLLTVHVFFDADADGLYDVGEVDLVDWQLTVGDNQVTQIHARTDPRGEAGQALAPGSYEVAVVYPTADPNASWGTTVIPAVTLATGETLRVEVPITCSCSDGDVCTVDSCFIGECSVASGGESGSDPTCDGIDEDCDGTPDDDFFGVSVSCGLGACEQSAVEVCVAGDIAYRIDGVVYATCVGDPAQGSTERCDYRDNDCDGQTDEGFALGVACTEGQSQCTSAGQTVCAADGLTTACNAPYVAPVSERCDGLDNDCDLVVDEDFAVGTSCTIGVGACQRSGSVVCVGSTGFTGCSAPVVAAIAEVCNDIDDDCDGETDEGAVCPVLDTIITSGPEPRTTETTVTFTYRDVISPENYRFECSLDLGPWMGCDGGIFTMHVWVEGRHTLSVRALDARGGHDTTPAVWRWEVDPTLPNTTLLATPESLAQTSTAKFVFGTDASGPQQWWCAIDVAGPSPVGEDWFRCDQSWTWTDLAEGAHAIWAYVVNGFGVADPTPVTYAWRIDTSNPGTELVGPEPFTCDQTPRFTFTGGSAADPAGGFVCRIDGGEAFDCDSGAYTANTLSEGEHVFEVAAVDKFDNVDPTPARSEFTVDLRDPETTVTTGPSDPAQFGSATFTFASDEVGATFECRVDARAFTPCDSPVRYEGLSDGPHRFEVRALDRACGLDETPAFWSWLVDSRFPETELTVVPPHLVGKDEDNRFEYRDPSGSAGDLFECDLDHEGWVSCDGGEQDLGALAVGVHVMHVRACERLGPALLQCDPTPATYSWEVSEVACPRDEIAPTLTCAEDVELECVDGVGTATAGQLDATVGDPCAPLDIEAESGLVFPLGESAVLVRATDGNNNQASCATFVTVTDTAAPTLTCPASVTLVSSPERCGVMHELPRAVANDGCASEVSVYSDAPAVFGLGLTTVTFHAVDPSGNRSTCSTGVTVIDDTPVALTCTDSLTYEAPADACAWRGTLSARASDNCAPEVSVLERTNSYAVGTQDVEFATADDSGNDARCTTVMTVRDVTLPVITCPAATTIVPARLSATATDACGAVLEVTSIGGVKIDASGARSKLSGTELPAVISGAAVEVTRRLTDGALELEMTWSARDPSGNTASTQCEITFAADLDQDGVVDADDNCPAAPNTDQGDRDEDAIGDVCDPRDNSSSASGSGGCAGGAGGGVASMLALLVGVGVAIGRRARRVLPPR